MKKIFQLIAFLFVASSAFAQMSPNRTTETKIADLLALQPAEDQSAYLEAMAELENNFSSEDVSALLSTITPPGGKNAKLEYVTNSYSYYVIQDGKEQARAVYENGLLDALNKVSDLDNKGYIIQLLQNCGKEGSIDAISTYLSDEYMAEKAARAISRIGGEKAYDALLTGLQNSSNEKSAIAIIGAMGELGQESFEKLILSVAKAYSSPEFQRTVLFALSNSGTKSSLKYFRNSLKEVDYKYDEKNTAGNAINFSKNLLHKGDKKSAEKLLKDISKQSLKNENNQTHLAAMQMLYTINPKKYHVEILKALPKSDKLTRGGYYRLIAQNTKIQDAEALLKIARFASPELQESVIQYFGEHGDKEHVRDLQGFLKSDNQPVRLAAINSVYALAGEDSYQLLISLLNGGSEQEIALIKSLLLSAKQGDPIGLVNRELAISSLEVQKILLEILAIRNNPETFAVVQPLLSSSNLGVRLAAYKTLPNLASEANLNEVITALETADKDEVIYAQQGVISAVSFSSQKESWINQLIAKTKQSENPSVYFPVFAGLGGDNELSTVKSFTSNADNGTKSAALKSLARWSNSTALPFLYEKSREQLSDEDFESVYGGFISQVLSSDHTVEQKYLYLRDAYDLARNTGQKRTALGALQQAPTYQGMMFAASLMDNNDLKGTASTVAMNIATENPQFDGESVRLLLEQAMENLSGSESAYLREAIIRHLSEMDDQEGFVSIFNGKDLTGWQGLVENPIKRKRMSASELEQKQAEANRIMREGWIIEDGVLVFNGSGDNIATIKQYGDIEMLVDWKLDTEGEEGDAGVYLRGTPQVQIWDTSRTNVGAEVGSGGLYNNQTHESIPLEVADNPLGEWNTFRIRMVGDKVTVYLNGVLVVDNVTLENYWDRSQPIFPIEQIELQAHGTKVYYRDIYVKELGGEASSITEEEVNAGFEVLFDGSNLDAWTGSDSYQIDNDGHLVVLPKEGSGGNFYTKKQFDNFVFRFDFKLTEGANNGVGIRTPMQGDPAYQGMEIQILDDSADVYKNLETYQYHGSVYGIIPAQKGALKPLGEWNSQEIHLDGDQIRVTLNGKIIVDGNLKEATLNGTLDGKDHPGLNRQEGHLAFLGHGSKVHFKNIRVKTL